MILYGISLTTFIRPFGSGCKAGCDRKLESRKAKIGVSRALARSFLTALPSSFAATPSEDLSHRPMPRPHYPNYDHFTAPQQMTPWATSGHRLKPIRSPHWAGANSEALFGTFPAAPYLPRLRFENRRLRAEPNAIKGNCHDDSFHS